METNVNRQQVEIDGERDAQSDTSKLLWFAVGLALNIVGILIAYIYQQTPPATRTFEKTQEYIVFYTEKYKSTSRNIQVKFAVIGFLVVLALMFTLILIYIALMLIWYSEMSDLQRLVGSLPLADAKSMLNCVLL